MNSASAVTLVAAVVGLLAAILGAAVVAASQHRQWLRGARLEAYSKALHAYDAAVTAAAAYVTTALFVLDLDDADAERLDPHLAAHWGEFFEATRALDERRAAVELVGTGRAHRAATLGAYLAVMTVNKLRLDDEDFDRTAAVNRYRKWRDDTEGRTRGRSLFVDAAKADLVTDPRLTRAGRSVQRLWSRMGRRARNVIERIRPQRS